MSHASKWRWGGAAAGLGFFALVVGVHVGEHGKLGPRLGCVVGLEARALNAPAELLAALVPNRVVAPQIYGESSPIDAPSEGYEGWSPVGFVAWGAACYALLGLAIGSLGARARRG